MVELSTSDLIQIGLGIAAVGAAVVALIVGAIDRRTQLAIAREARAQERLAIELDYALRLALNLARGGSSDDEERSRLGSEALALTMALGPRRVPREWARVMDGRTAEEISAALDDESSDMPDWVRRRNEAGVAVRSIAAELYRD